MFKFPQSNYTNIPSGSITSVFPKSNQAHPTNPNHQQNQLDSSKCFVSQVETPNPNYSGNIHQILPKSEITNNPEEVKHISLEFEQLVKEKLGKIDEILIALKEKQQGPNEIKYQEPQHLAPPPVNHQIPIQQPAIPVTAPVFNIQKTEKVSKGKKTYYNITDNMWTELKNKYTELPDEFRTKTFSDGTNYYVEMKNKKILLDGKGLLKLLNTKTKI